MLPAEGPTTSATALSPPRASLPQTSRPPEKPASEKDANWVYCAGIKQSVRAYTVYNSTFGLTNSEESDFVWGTQLTEEAVFKQFKKNRS